MQVRLLTIAFAVCICITFVNYIDIKNDLERLPSQIDFWKRAVNYGSNGSMAVYNLSYTKFQYFIVLYRLFIVTTLCIGFAIMCQRKIEGLTKIQLPQPHQI